MGSSDKRVALVTGASTGIGREEAIALAKAGYEVAINYARSAGEAEKTAAACHDAGANTLLIQADVADEADVEKMTGAVEEKFGRLDVLCNNAGTTTTGLYGSSRLTLKIGPGLCGQCPRVFLVTKHAAPLLKASDDACVINTNSIVGLLPGTLPYSAARCVMDDQSAGRCARPVGGPANGVPRMEGDWMERMLGDNYDKLMDARQADAVAACRDTKDVAQTVMTLVDGNKSVSGQIRRRRQLASITRFVEETCLRRQSFRLSSRRNTAKRATGKIAPSHRISPVVCRVLTGPQHRWRHGRHLSRSGRTFRSRSAQPAGSWFEPPTE